MTKYSTGNPVGSADPRDLYDTATVADKLVQGADAAYPDRLGVSRRSWKSVEAQADQQATDFDADQADRVQRFNDFLASSGYDFAGDYAAGIEITEYNQVIRDTAGEFWRASGSTTLPYTTTGTGLPEGGAFVAVGDAVLRQELAGDPASGQGAALVGGATIYVGSVAEGISGLPVIDGQSYQVNGWQSGSEIGGGAFVGRSSIAKSQHNGGTIISPTVPPVSAQAGATLAARIANFLAGAGETDSTGSGVLVRENSIAVSVAMFGATGDNVIDDYAPLKAANLSDASWIGYFPDTYYTTKTVPFASNKQYFGTFRKTVIRTDQDLPAGASRAYLTEDGAISPTGNLEMYGLTFSGVKTNANNLGFILFDYYSKLTRVVASACGGGGIKLTQANDLGTISSGTLVENRLYSCEVRKCGGILLDLGEADNNKLTDGYAEGAILDGEDGLTAQHLFCGSAAGWQIDGAHCYGSTASFVAELQNCNNTRFTDFFIEAFTDRAINAPKIQGDTVISGHINANQAANGAWAVALGQSAIVENVSVKVDIGVSLDVATSGINCIYNTASAGDIRATVRLQGSQKDLLNLVSGSDAGRINQVRIMADATVYGTLKDAISSDSISGLKHEAKRLAYGFNPGRLSGNSPITVSVPVKVPSFNKLAGTVTIEANSFDNGANRARYHGMFFMSAKTNGTDGWVSTLTDIIAPSGFSATPTISAVNSSGDDGTVEISFTFTDSSATGTCVVLF